MEKVVSTNIRAIGYDPETWHLTIEFVTGRVWTYAHVPVEVYHSLRDAPSPGSYFYYHVRHHYPGVPVMAAPPLEEQVKELKEQLKRSIKQLKPKVKPKHQGA